MKGTITRQIRGACFVFVFTLVSCSGSGPVNSKSYLNIGGPLEVEMWASSGCVRPGDKVLLRATVSNKTAKSFSVEVKGRPVLDIVLDNPDSGPRWSQGKPLTPDQTRLELKPGESKSIEMDWVGEYGSKNITAVFRWSEKFPALEPGVTVNVGNCPGFLGP